MDAIQDIVLPLHSITRWLAVITGLAVVIKLAAAWQQRSSFGPADRGLMAAFTGLLDLQALLGLIVLIGLGFNMVRVEHAVTMIVALVVVHLSARWRRAPDPIRFRNNLIAVVAALAIILVGVAVLPAGWRLEG